MWWILLFAVARLALVARWPLCTGRGINQMARELLRRP